MIGNPIAMAEASSDQSLNTKAKRAAHEKKRRALLSALHAKDSLQMWHVDMYREIKLYISYK